MARRGASPTAYRAMRALPWGALALLLLAALVQESRASVIPRRVMRHLLQSAQRGRQDFEDDSGAQLCPRGTYMEKAYDTLNTQNVCAPCTDGEDFTEHPNSLEACLTCTTCKEGEEEVSRCSTTQNTKCRCKSGTFCPPDHPCEVCVRCKTRCPEGEELVSPCNATTDAQCARPTGPPTTQKYEAWIVPVAVIFIILSIIILSITVYCLRKRKMNLQSKGGSSGSRCRVSGPVALANRFLKWGCNTSTPESLDNIRNNARDPAMEPILSLEMQNNGVQNQAVVLKTLIAVNGDESQTLRDAFPVFVDVVSIRQWPSFMRKIGLTDNDVERVKVDYSSHGVQEQHFQMLCMWFGRVGHVGSLNTLLHALLNNGAREEAELIETRLLERNMYCQGTES